jgi:methionyl-tRNA synthetase
MTSLLQNTASIELFIVNHPFLFTALLVWSLVWKALALWKSAQLSHRWWFAAILIVNTLGILEIIYLYFVAKKYSVRIETGE